MRNENGGQGGGEGELSDEREWKRNTVVENRAAGNTL